MEVLKINLKGLVEILGWESTKKYAVAIIDNSPPSQPKLPLIGRNFIWVAKMGSIPTGRKELEELFLMYGIKVEKDQWIAVFHHHDFREPYLQCEEKVEYYEFSHTGSIAYRAFCHADANLLSHMLSGTFRKYDKLILMKAGLSENEMEELQKYWIFKFEKLEGIGEQEFLSEYIQVELEGFDKENIMLCSIALKLTGGKIVPDPKRYKPEVHDELFKSEMTVDQYAIPAMFRDVEIQTGTKLDDEVAKRMLGKKTDWQKEIERLVQEKKVELTRIAREKELRERGELLPKDAQEYIDSIAPSLGCDYTGTPLYPVTRKDIAVVKRSVDNGSSYGYDIVYLVWLSGNEIKAKKLIDSTSTKDYINIRSVIETESGIKIEVGSGGSYSGRAWNKTFEIPFAELAEVMTTISRNNENNEEERLSLGIENQADFMPDEVVPYMKIMSEQMARLGMAKSGKKTKGEEMLKSKYSDLLENLKKKLPNLFNLSRLNVICEVYDDALIKETFSLLEMIRDSKVADEALHILGEMAMMKNNPVLYLNVVNLLKSTNDTGREKILLDDRLEFQTDEIIESALKEY